MLEHDKKVIKTYITIVWGIVLFVPLLIVVASIIQYISFERDIKNGQEAYFNTLNQVYSSEIISIHELDSIKNQLLLDTTYVFDDRMKNRFQSIEKSIIRHSFIIDSLNNENLFLFEGKIDSLNNSIDLFNRKVNKMQELKIDFELKTNVFYSLVLLIIALTAFLGYRSFVNIKSSVKEDAIDEARRTSKLMLTDDVKITIMDLVRKEDIISESWADFEQNIESKLADFKQSISSDMDSSDSAKIEILERQVNEILKKINEREV